MMPHRAAMTYPGSWKYLPSPPSLFTTSLSTDSAEFSESSRFDTGAAIEFARSTATAVYVDSLMAKLRYYSSIDAVLRRWRSKGALKVECASEVGRGPNWSQWFDVVQGGSEAMSVPSKRSRACLLGERLYRN